MKYPTMQLIDSVPNLTEVEVEHFIIGMDQWDDCEPGSMDYCDYCGGIISSIGPDRCLCGTLHLGAIAEA